MSGQAATGPANNPSIRPGIESLLTDAERVRLSEAGFGRRVGMGRRAACVVIDVQNYMVGRAHAGSYPSSCGEAGTMAVDRLARVLPELRGLGVPIVFTKFELRADGSDAGVYALKRDLLKIETWCIEGTVGAQLAPQIELHPNDQILVKKKPSAFFGTPLLSLFVGWQIDTVLIAGGSTSNCVRATAMDSSSYNFRTVVLEDCVFDRVALSHEVTLFDLDRQFADVRSSDEVVRELSKRPESQ